MTYSDVGNSLLRMHALTLGGATLYMLPMTPKSTDPSSSKACSASLSRFSLCSEPSKISINFTALRLGLSLGNRFCSFPANCKFATALIIQVTGACRGGFAISLRLRISKICGIDLLKYQYGGTLRINISTHFSKSPA